MGLDSSGHLYFFLYESLFICPFRPNKISNVNNKFSLSYLLSINCKKVVIITTCRTNFSEWVDNLDRKAFTPSHMRAIGMFSQNNLPNIFFVLSF